MPWSPDHYLRFGEERTRPALDLAHRISLSNPRTIVDLGCGPGNSTQVLRARWPEARVVGIDRSAEMIRAAEETYPHQDWFCADIETWLPEARLDLVFSNAALQWLPDHARLVRRLFDLVGSSGALAFQIPSDAQSPVRRAIRRIASDPRWRDRTRESLEALTMHSPGFYYDALIARAHSLDLWETEYAHVLDDAAAVVEWISSTGLRPVLEALAPDERAEFRSRLTTAVRDEYPARADGRVLYPFRRLFVIAYTSETGREARREAGIE